MRHKAHRLDLGRHRTAPEKFEAIIKYLQIKDIFCKVANPEDYRFSKPTKKIEVIEVIFKGGHSSYVKTTLNECLEIMDQSLNKMLNSDLSQKEINTTLNKIKSASEAMQEMFDPNDRLKFFDRYHYRILLPKEKPILHSSHLEIHPNAANEIDEQFSLRKNFFQKMTRIINKKISEHTKILKAKKNPYKWTSKNPEFEIAELIYALTLSGRLVPSKQPRKFNLFIEEFYDLFGLRVNDYNQKVQSILKRKRKKSFLTDLAGQINGLM